MLNIMALLPSFLAILFFMTVIAVLFIVLPLYSKKERALSPNFLTMVLFSLFCMLSGVLYWQWGAPNKILDHLVLNKISKTLQEIHDKPGNKQQLLADFAALENKIAFSDVGLAYLASMYVKLGLYDQAIRALDKAIFLAPGQIEYQEQWIYSHSLRHEGKLSIPLRAQAEIFAKKHNSYHVMNLLAIDDYFQEKYAQAILGWQFILAKDETLDDSRRQVLQNAIQTAEQLNNKKAPALDPAEVALEINVSLAPSLKSKVRHQDTVFVYVKSIENNGPPLAVIKKQAAELPFTVKLDNNHSMIAGSRLVAAQRVKVFAKISKSGDAFNKTDILAGNSHEIMLKFGTQPLQITINQQI